MNGSPSVLISQSSTATIRARLRRVQDRVVEPVVAVDDRVLALRRQVAQEVLAQRVERRQLGDLRRLPLLRPAAQLALHEAGGPSELRQAHGCRVDGVEGGERVDEPLPDRPALRGVSA